MRLRGLALVPGLTLLPALAAAQPGQFNPVDRAAPVSPPRLAPPISPPMPQAQTGPGAENRVRLGEVGVQGNQAVAAAALAPALDGLAGQQVPLARVEEARLGILRLYREAGFPFAAVSAGLTARGDGSADLRFAITEGYVAEVKLDGDIGPAGSQVLRFLNRLIGQRPLSTAALERALLLAADIPGVTVSSTLRPMATEPGALQLVVQLRRRVVSGYGSFDNRGSRTTGPLQWLGVVGLNSLTEFGERTEVSLFGAEGSTQWFTQGSVEAFIGGSGLRLRFYGGGGQARPGDVLAAIGYVGDTTVAGVQLSYPVVRSRPLNLTLLGMFDVFNSTVDSRIGGTSTRLSHDSVRTVRLGLDYQWLDNWVPWLPAAGSFGNLRLSQGIGGLGAGPGSDQPGRIGSEYDFTKLSGELQRNQPLFRPTSDSMLSVQGLVQGQWSDNVLPLAEKFYLGGARLGRGFYAGQATGDRAWGVSVELQFDIGYDIPTEPVLGNGRGTTQFYLFRDYGRTYENQRSDPNRRLSSWGGGARLIVSDTFHLDLEAVRRLTTRVDGANATPLRETALIFRSMLRF